MKKTFFLLSLITLSYNAFTHETDSLLLGRWNLIKFIDNMTGDEIIPPKAHEDFVFFIEFSDSLVNFNLEINKCENTYKIIGEHQIKFLYYDECTKICCDQYFSTLLTYEQCTHYYLKSNDVLVLVCEDRVFYFSRMVN